MEANLQKELKQLQKRKVKAQNNGDILEEGKLCNAAGTLLSQYGHYEKAVLEHTQEVHLSEVAQDTIGCAVAHRKVGECLCALNKYKEALFHQNLHLKLAKSAGNLVEEQRAYATIGRTWFVHSDTATNREEVEDCLLESQSAYLKSLSVCDKLREAVTEKELLEMRSRLYLNLGLTYETQKDPSRAKRFMEKALVIARDQGLRDTEYRCLYSLGSVKMRSDEDAYALRCFEQALQVARQGNNKFDEADALHMLGKIFLKLGEFSAGRQNLKKAYIILRARRSDDMEEFKSTLIAAIKGIKLQRKQAKLSEYSSDEQIKILESLGDLYCQVRAFQKALGCYRKELELASAAGKPRKVLSSIIVSLAITYSDLKRPADAINCYMEELEIMEGNYKEACDTWCNIANVHELSGHDYQEVKDAYFKALEYAEMSAKPNVMLRVWKCLADTQKLFGKTEEYQNSSQKVLDLQSQLGVVGDDSEVDEEPEEITGNDDSDDDGCDRERLIEREMLLPDSDDDLDQDEEEPQSTRPRRKRRKQLNEKGETPLHEAAICGNLQRVKVLLEKGADVNARDYCGWLPLHEACNHGHKEIAEALLKAGANVNDQGGVHCQGITPLHDAAANGHIDVVRVLLSHQASVNLKDKNGMTALDTVIKIRRLDEEDDGSGTKETKYTIGRRQVVRFLRHFKGGQNDADIRSRNAVFDEDANEVDGSVVEGSIMTLKRNDMGRGQGKLKQSFSEECFEEDSEEMFHSQPINQALIIDKEDSQENQCEMSTNHASPSRTLPPSITNSLQEEDYSVNGGLPLALCTDDQTPNDPSEFDEIDLCDNDSTYASMDEDCGVENLDADYESPFTESSSVCYMNPLNGSRLDEPKTQQPALVAGQRDWLVNDTGQRSIKRKRPAKQTKITASVLRQRTSSGPGRPTSKAVLRTSKAPSKQSKLAVSKQPIKAHSSIRSSAPLGNPLVNSACRGSSWDAISVEHGKRAPPATVGSGVNTPSLSKRPNMAPDGTAPMRLRVQVQEMMFLIPCPRSNDNKSEKSIGWLAEQASLRYFSSVGLRPVLTLKTREDAFLSPEDKITDVLSNNEEVIASVESWDLPVLSERYRTACISANTSVTMDVFHILEAEPHLSALNLPKKGLREIQVLPLFRALQCHDCLTKLLLPGNRIGDSGIQHLVCALPTLPSLAVLDLRSNGITHKGLSLIANALIARDSTGHGAQQETKALQNLESLDVGFNWLGNPCGSSLACILQKCPILATLRIDSCGLTSQVTAQGNEFSCALKASRLQELSVSYNSLGSWAGSNLIKALPSASLHYLNLASSIGEKGTQSAVESLVEFMEIGCVLHDVILRDCDIGSKHLELLMQCRHSFSGLQHLDLSCNNIGSDALPSLTRLLKQSTCLLTLTLAGNEGLGNSFAASLFSLAKDSISLQKLDLSASGVTSPLAGTLFDAVKKPGCETQGKGPLKEVDLSHNLLTPVDKQRLAEQWKEFCSGQSFSYLDSSLCLLAKS